MHSSLPTGSNPIAPLHEFVVTEHKVRRLFRDLPIGQVFWLPTHRRWYIKSAEDMVEAVEPEYVFEHKMRVTDPNFEVEL